MKVLVETVLNRSNFVTLISIICITLFILLQEVERETQQGKAIESFINTSFEVLHDNVTQVLRRFGKPKQKPRCSYGDSIGATCYQIISCYHSSTTSNNNIKVQNKYIHGTKVSYAGTRMSVPKITIWVSLVVESKHTHILISFKKSYPTSAHREKHDILVSTNH